jgi:uncharacterized membrane protein
VPLSSFKAAGRLGSRLPFLLLALACQPAEKTVGPAEMAGRPAGVDRASFEASLALLRPPGPPRGPAGPVSSNDVAQSQSLTGLASSAVATIGGPIQFGQDLGVAHAINSLNQTAGQVEEFDNVVFLHALRWDAQGGGTELRPRVDTSSASASDLNDAGVVVGVDYEYGAGTFPTRWAADNSRSRLPPAPGPTDFQAASAINNNGVVVGVVAYPARAVRWDAQGAHALPLGNGDSSTVYDLNDAGTAVGWVSSGIDKRPAKWPSATALVLLSLPTGARGGYAAAINKLGQAVGQVVYRSAGGAVVRTEAVRWSATGVPTLLPGLGFSGASAINDAGVVAGWSSADELGGSQSPVIWAGGQRFPVPIGTGGGGPFPLTASITDMNAGQLAGVSNTEGSLNFERATRWPFTVTGTCTAAAITTQPKGVTAVLGRPAALSVAGTGTAPLTYQWRKFGEWISGATSATYRIAAARLTDAGTYTVVVKNGCGSVASRGARIEVHYDFGGFFSPVANPGPTAPYTVNTVVAGNNVPIRFSLNGNRGLNVLATGSPASKAVACTLADPGGVATISAGDLGLTYDSAAGRYQYVWKTQKAWAGTCRQLTLALKDGTKHRALFRFTQ